VALGHGIRDGAWDRLMDGIIHELRAVDRVMFLVPGGFEAEDQGSLLDTLEQILTARGVNVERRHVP
jgi:hypothetical protein